MIIGVDGLQVAIGNLVGEVLPDSKLLEQRLVREHLLECRDRPLVRPWQRDELRRCRVVWLRHWYVVRPLLHPLDPRADGRVRFQAEISLFRDVRIRKQCDIGDAE